MKNELLFIKEEPYLKNLGKAFKKFSSMFSKGEKIAIKTHMGEYGNLYYPRPPIIGKIVEILNTHNTKPFVFDSPSIYLLARRNSKKYLETARKNGFTNETIGCPIIISNEGDVVCKNLKEAEGMVVVSHVKGHMCSGFGAAIKNLGMGGVTKKEKRRIHIGKFDKQLAKGAYAVLKTFKKDKVLFINLLIDIVKNCDCATISGQFLVNNIGILIGKDIVAIDQASFDLVKEKAGKDVFKEAHDKSPEEHINYAAQLGMGNKEYTLKIF